MLNKFYKVLQHRLAQVEKDLYDLSKKQVEDGHRHYLKNLYSYMFLGVRYLICGVLEFFVKFFVLICKNPEESYKIITAPLEKFEREHLIGTVKDFDEFTKLHKKARVFSFSAFVSSVLAVVVVSLTLSFVIPTENKNKVKGASFAFTQTDWSTLPPSNSTECTNAGGTWDVLNSLCYASDPQNQTGWTTYTSTSTGMFAGQNITLQKSAKSFIDAKTPTIPTGASGGGFRSGTFSKSKIDPKTKGIKLVFSTISKESSSSMYYIKSDGTVWAWGIGGFGNGSTTGTSTPIQIQNLSGSISITSRISSYSIKSDGTLWAWGNNDSGQLGDGTLTTRLTPVQVSNLIDVVDVSGNLIPSIPYLGMLTSAYALKSDGTVWAWGGNNYGQLGDGTTTDKLTPIQVSSLTDIVMIASGYGSAYALKSDGTVWAWGVNSYGALGDGTNVNRSTPVQVSGLTNVISISANYYSAYALKSDGTVWAWGYNTSGKLGDGTTTDRYTPVQVASLTDVFAIASGFYSAYALKSDGTVWAWGSNSYGQLGDGTTTDRYTPVQVLGLANIVGITGGDFSAYALKSDGTLWAWGRNNYGQLGDGTTTNRYTPVQVDSTKIP